MQRFSSSFLLCEKIFSLGDTSCVTAVEESHNVCSSQAPRQSELAEGLGFRWRGSAAPLGDGTAVDLRLWKKGLLCLLFAVLISGPSIQPSTSLIILHWDTDGPKLFPLCFPKRNDSVFAGVLCPSSTSKDGCGVCL